MYAGGERRQRSRYHRETERGKKEREKEREREREREKERDERDERGEGGLDKTYYGVVQHNVMPACALSFIEHGVSVLGT
jgi:hypothetical protein